ncbi:hypothetical protein J2X31_003643 [Flavobacterium arsenatis]|uniref:Uncharacterized protein n=1 Tax=Flavobacterium arsenatis TaxID=1484332 RepID=A0ABU1TUS9_9FLAO|nr:hypothetical protein [Flavobacterium arsenatis]MDR6969610.1 hypothetical protein [Flavobacterium arsenatis]
MQLKLIFFLLVLPFFGNAQNTDFDVKIYSHKSSTFENKFWLVLYKIDWNAKTIQYAQVHLKEGDEVSDLKSIRQIFRNAIPASKFIVLNPNKIKVERIRRKRNWLNFATPRIKSSPAERYFINGDTLGRRKKGGGYVLDKELTLRYQQENQKSGN